MKICLIGHFRVKYQDEGVRNVSAEMAQRLSKRHDVLAVDISAFYQYRLIGKFKPDIIHLLVGPNSIFTFSIARVIGFMSNAKVILSALQPSSFYFEMLIPFIKPDLVLIQSNKYKEFFERFGCNTSFFPNCVDTERFFPASKEFKIALRAKYNIGLDKFVILHVGPIKKDRNVSIFNALQNDNNQVIIVARDSQANDVELYQSLKRSGCIIIGSYVENIRDIYVLSDCFVFPTINERACIEMPLSILEAMACNLPIITSEFRAIPKAFSNGEGFFFAESETKFEKYLDIIKYDSLLINTRKKVLMYSCACVISELEKVYTRIIVEGSSNHKKQSNSFNGTKMQSNNNRLRDR